MRRCFWQSVYMFGRAKDVTNRPERSRKSRLDVFAWLLTLMAHAAALIYPQGYITYILYSMLKYKEKKKIHNGVL